MVEEHSYPENGGMWMAKADNNTSSYVDWSPEKHHLSDTIHEAVFKAVAEIKSRS